MGPVELSPADAAPANPTQPRATIRIGCPAAHTPAPHTSTPPDPPCHHWQRLRQQSSHNGCTVGVLSVHDHGDIDPMVLLLHAQPIERAACRRGTLAGSCMGRGLGGSVGARKSGVGYNRGQVSGRSVGMLRVDGARVMNTPKARGVATCVAKRHEIARIRKLSKMLVGLSFGRRSVRTTHVSLWSTHC